MAVVLRDQFKKKTANNKKLNNFHVRTCLVRTSNLEVNLNNLNLIINTVNTDYYGHLYDDETIVDNHSYIVKLTNNEIMVMLYVLSKSFT